MKTYTGPETREVTRSNSMGEVYTSEPKADTSNNIEVGKPQSSAPCCGCFLDVCCCFAEMLCCFCE